MVATVSAVSAVSAVSDGEGSILTGTNGKTAKGMKTGDIT